MRTGIILGLLFVFLLVVHSDAGVLTLQNGLNGYTGTRDTMFTKTTANDAINYGAYTTMTIGAANEAGTGEGVLIGFDDLFGGSVNQVPAGQTITGATLRIYCYNIDGTSEQPLTASPMHSDWVEGSGVGTIVEGASCNMARHYRSDSDYTNHPEDAWGTAGQTEHNGDSGPHLYVDYFYSDAALVPWPAATGWIEWDVTTVLQQWYAGTRDNAGWMVRLRYNQHSRHYCYSSEYTDDTALRPQLVIEYEAADPCELVLQNGFNGYAGTRDTAFNKTASLDTFNYGGVPTMVIGSANDAGSSGGLLVSFDDLFGMGSNQISADRIITSATLRIYCYSIYSTSDQPLTASPMHSGWVEGDGNGTVVEGASCNMARHYRIDGDYAAYPEDAWGTSGLPNTSENGPDLGVDYRYDDAALVPWPASTGWIEWDVTTAVQGWQDGTLENNGWMVRLRYNQHSMHRCYSSEYTDDILLRPQLVIRSKPYAPDPCAPIFQDGCNGYDGTADVGLTEDIAPGYSNANNGAAQSMRISNADGDHDHALIRFDDIFGDGQGQIPPGGGTMIARATLRLTSFCQHVEGHADTMRMVVAPMLTDFVECSSIAAAQAGASCRNARHYRSDGNYAANPGDAWGTAGVVTNGPVADIDYDTGVQACRDLLNMELPGVFGQDFRAVAIDVTGIVQAWTDGSIPNKGLRLTAEDPCDYWDVYTSDYAVSSYRPMLIVQYTSVELPSDTILFKQGWNGYQGTEDLWMQQYNPGPSNWNFGGRTDSMINNPTYYHHSSLIRFKDIFGMGVHQIPYDADIYVATLRLWTYDWTHDAGTRTPPYQAELELQPMLTDWTEGNSNGSATGGYVEGESCQAARHYRPDGDYANHPEDAWGYNQEIPADGPLEGYDFEDPNHPDMGVITKMAPISEVPEHQPIEDGIWMEWDITDIVRSWQAESLPNYGLYAFQNKWLADGVYFSTSEHPDILKRPELRVTYRPFTCDHSAVPYPSADAGGPEGKRDCYVDEYDLMQLAGDWLGCTMPNVDGCVDISGDQLYIAEADITVDAALTEWADATWYDMSVVYYGEPNDLGTAVGDVKFAVKWDDAANKVCAAVQVADYDHVFETVPTNWNTSDRIEVYAQGDANGGVGWGWVKDGLPNYDKAQQYAVGYHSSIFNTTWGRFGNGRYLGGLPLEYFATVDGDTIIYEVGVPMYIWYGGISDPADPCMTIRKDLMIGDIVGFDIVVNSKRTDGFGMRSQNDMVGKFNNADQFLHWELVGSTCGPWGLYAGDVDADCEVGLADFAVMAGQWLYCTEPTDTNCDTSWMP